MLQEAFDLPSTQILSLHALASYRATRPQLAVSEAPATATRQHEPSDVRPNERLTVAPRCVQVSGERALGASLLICGLRRDDTAGLGAQLLGNALLGVDTSFFHPGGGV